MCETHGDVAFVVFQLFDMNKFQTNLSRETRRAYPDRRRLEMQCLSAIIFVRTEADLLQCPIWVLIVNVVGLDMLKSKLPPGTPSQAVRNVKCSTRVTHARVDAAENPPACANVNLTESVRKN